MNRTFITEISREVVTEDGTFRVIRRANLLDGEVLFAAYERLPFMGSHHTFKKDDAGWWGNVADRNLTDELDKRLAGAPERRQAVEAFYSANRRLAHALIAAAFPEAKQGIGVGGGIALSLSNISLQAEATRFSVYSRGRIDTAPE